MQTNTERGKMTRIRANQEYRNKLEIELNNIYFKRTRKRNKSMMS